MNGAGHIASRITREAAQWHAMQRDTGLDPTQQARFMEWLVRSPSHLREYLAVGQVASELGQMLRAPAESAVVPAPDNVVAWPSSRRRPNVSPVRRPRSVLPRVGIAAALLACIGITLQVAWPRTARHVAMHGAPRSLELPDRTRVHLNADSEIVTRFSLFDRRVELTRGQASFVVADERRPFAVHAAGLQVQDIGTTFDVSLRREQARVAVAEGRVQVFGEGGAGRLLADLKAGQGARVDYRDHAVSIHREDVDSMTAWWQRRVVFRDEPLRDIADQFNRLNRVRLQVDDDAAGALRLTGNLDGHDVASLRAFLERQPALRLEAHADRIVVRGRRIDGAHSR